MATVTPTISRDVGERDGSSTMYTWALVTANVDGAPLEHSEWADRTWTATGTWGGATLSFEGSNDGTNYITLTTAAGDAATLTADGCKTITETPRYVRPKLTTAGVGAAVTVILFARRHTGLRT